MLHLVMWQPRQREAAARAVWDRPARQPLALTASVVPEGCCTRERERESVNTCELTATAAKPAAQASHSLIQGTLETTAISSHLTPKQTSGRAWPTRMNAHATVSLCNRRSSDII